MVTHFFGEIVMSELIIEDRILTCPNCGGEYLHQKDVQIFTREGEDRETKKTVVNSGTGKVNQMDGDQSAENPSSRRGGMSIFFMCEYCTSTDNFSPLYQLNIYQHKGQTFMEWSEH